MNERIYKTMRNTGAANLTIGIIVMATGISAGILMIIHGVRLLKSKNQVLI